MFIEFVESMDTPNAAPVKKASVSETRPLQASSLRRRPLTAVGNVEQYYMYLSET